MKRQYGVVSSGELYVATKYLILRRAALHTYLNRWYVLGDGLHYSSINLRIQTYTKRGKLAVNSLYYIIL